jgi:O-antigen/teichoic acid export membrane protein
LSDYGFYSLFSPLLFIFINSLTGGFSRFFITKYIGSEKNKLVVFYSISFFLGIIAALFLLLFNIFSDKIMFFLKMPSEYNSILLILSVLVFFGVFIEFNIAFLISYKRLVYASFVSFIYSSLVFILTFIYFFFSGSFDLIVLFRIWFLSFLIILLFSYYSQFSKLKVFISNLKISISAIKEGVVFALPLIVYSISYWVVMASNRFILNFMTSSEKVAVFSLVYSLLTIIFTFVFTINNVIYPYISEAFNVKKDYTVLFNILLKYSLIIILPALVFFLAMGKEIIFMVSGEKYLVGVALIPYLIIYPILAFSVFYLSNHLMLRGKNWTICIVYLVGMLLNIILSIFLIPRFDYFGAAIATVVSYLLMVILTLFFTKKYINLDFNYLRLFRIILATALSGLLLSLFNPQIFITKIMFLLAGGIFYILILFILKVFVKSEIVLLKKYLKFLPK